MQASRAARIAALPLFALLSLSGCALQRGYEAALLLSDVAADGGPSTLQKTAPPPTRLSVQYTVEDRAYQADCYQPGQPPRAGIVLVHGLAEAGPKDPRLVAFAVSLARVRFAVFVPDLSGLRALRVSTNDVQVIVDAFSYLSTRTDLAPQARIGIGAFSYGVGLALLAAMDQRISNDVAFVLAVGGYNDLSSVITFFTTGYFKDNGAWRFLRPNEFGKWTFVLSNAERVSDRKDQRLLQHIAERKLQDLAAPTADLADQLGPEGQAVYALVTNTEPERVPELLARLPGPMRADLTALNLANKDLAQLHAHVILIHGRDDNIIPYTESIALKRRLQDQAELFLIDGLHHVDVRLDPADLYRLWQSAYALLLAGDRASAAKQD